MIVSELIKELQTMPQDLDVLMAADEEGNGFTASIEIENDTNQCVILWPGHFEEIDDVIKDYEYLDEE